MSFWTEQDVLEYISLTGISYAQVYGEIIKDKDGKYHTTKCDRTGCVFCGFGCHLEKEPNRFQRLKETHPKLWEYCMRDWDKGGLGMKNVLEYIWTCQEKCSRKTHKDALGWKNDHVFCSGA